jgi:hypothetical protein
MPRQALVKPMRDKLEERKAEPQTGRSLGSVLIESIASGAGSGIGFSLVQSFMRPLTVEKDPKVCEQYDINLQRCMYENDMETCHKIFKDVDKNFYKRCVPNGPEISKE